ncbi:MAG TPA: hypothetical protein VMU25_00445 [Candidatus Paceibacterota bacterium]|nr:hypothetical protein [Candidatus Paceibacterota bacterium]
MRRAFFACYEKDDSLVRIARLLYNYGWSLMGTVGTARFLNENGVPCRDVSQIIGPMMLRHRIVTLDRKIFAGLLAKSDEDITELHTLGILPIDLVYIRLFPIQKTIANPRAGVAEVAEDMDLGGPVILSAAVKGGRLALCDPNQIDDLESWLKQGGKKQDCEKLFFKFAATATRYVADHIEMSAQYWERQEAIHMGTSAKPE